jgi:hypothetical protein
LSDTLGVAEFPSGEASRIGKIHPDAYLCRTFLRETIGFGGEKEAADNGFGGTKPVRNLTFTVGNLSARCRYKYGFGINLEQEIRANLGAFARLGWNDGKNQTYDLPTWMAPPAGHDRRGGNRQRHQRRPSGNTLRRVAWELPSATEPSTTARSGSPQRIRTGRSRNTWS